VGGWRGNGLCRGSGDRMPSSDGEPAASLFHPPPSEPDLQRFRVSGSPVDLFDGLCRSPCRLPSMDRDVAFLPRSSMMSSVVSASRMSRTSTNCHQVHLSPFAMYPVFPDSDYYGDSVALGLAPLRQS